MAGKLFGRGREAAKPPEPYIPPARRSAAVAKQATELFRARDYAAALPLLRQAVATLRESSMLDLRSQQQMLGAELSMLARSLRQTGADRDALAAAEESVEILTPLGGSQPFLRPSLLTIVACLTDLSERPEDLAEVTHRLAKLYAHEEDLDQSYMYYNRAANALIKCGRLSQARNALADSIEMLEAVVRTDKAQQSRLAVNYSAIAALHAKVGDFDEALAAAKSTAAVLALPDLDISAASRLRVAQNLTDLSIELTRGRRRDEAVGPNELAVAEFGKLHADARTGIESRFARCLNHHAWNLCKLLRSAEAVPHAERAVALLKDADAPGGARLRSFWGCLDTYATALAMSGRSDEALAPARTAYELALQLAEMNPDSDGSADSERSVARSEWLLEQIAEGASGDLTGD